MQKWDIWKYSLEALWLEIATSIHRWNECATRSKKEGLQWFGKHMNYLLESYLALMLLDNVEVWVVSFLLLVWKSLNISKVLSFGSFFRSSYNGFTCLYVLNSLPTENMVIESVLKNMHRAQKAPSYQLL